MFQLFAVTTRGLEAVSAAEMAEIRGVRNLRTAYRRVHATFTGDIAPLLQLRTVDDLFIQLAEWQGIGPHRAMLERIEALARDLDPWQAANLRAAGQPWEEMPTFSVSANFVGRRNYSADEIKLAVAKGVEAITGWRYHSDDRASDLNLRLFIEHEQAIVGLRLASTPLHRRAYKQEHLPGSLKPPVAAAMLRLADVTPAHHLLDPCCGAGTILIEAATLGAHVTGGDQNAEAIALTRRNTQAANVVVTVEEWDVRNLPLEAGSVDRIVTNLPWGRQVEVDATLADFYAESCGEFARVLAKEGRMALLTNVPDLVHFPTGTVHLQIEQRVEISLFGQQPTILIVGTNTPETS